jgi:prolyl-tRNA synthetase
VAAAAIEQNHDERGIIWPEPLAPYRVTVVPINYQKSARVREAADGLYRALQAAGLEPMLDDRDERPGVKFADAELYGIPHRLVVGERGIDAGRVEYRERRSLAVTEIPIDGVVSYLRDRATANSGAAG